MTIFRDRFVMLTSQSGIGGGEGLSFQDNGEEDPPPLLRRRLQLLPSEAAARASPRDEDDDEDGSPLLEQA